MIFRSTFQFTPLREGRQSAKSSRNRTAYFNSRPSARGDEQHQYSRNPLAISIHAPPRGATEAYKRAHPEVEDFNSRPSARGDNDCESSQQRHSDFNSRPSARGDMAAYDEKDKKDNFNSRPSARGDVIMITKGFPQRVFQFTPLREGRRVRVLVAAIIGAISIHAPPRGATDALSAWLGG